MAARIFAGFSGLARKPQTTQKHMAARVFAGFSGLAGKPQTPFRNSPRRCKDPRGRLAWRDPMEQQERQKKKKRHSAPTVQKHMAARFFVGFFHLAGKLHTPFQVKKVL